MTIRGGGNPRLDMAFAPRFRMGPPPRSFASDAYNCIMVPVDMRPTEYKFVARWSRLMASSPPIVPCPETRPRQPRRQGRPIQMRYVTKDNVMPRGRQPAGEHTLSNAERQARYRARRHEQVPKPVIRYRRPADRRSRAQRWRDAVTELVTLQPEYVAWLDSLPDNLRATPTGEALQAIADLDLDALAEIDPPRGYGRD